MSSDFDIGFSVSPSKDLEDRLLAVKKVADDLETAIRLDLDGRLGLVGQVRNRLRSRAASELSDRLGRVVDRRDSVRKEARKLIGQRLAAAAEISQPFIRDFDRLDAIVQGRPLPPARPLSSRSVPPGRVAVPPPGQAGVSFPSVLWSCWLNREFRLCACKQGVTPPDDTPGWELVRQTPDVEECIRCTKSLVEGGWCQGATTDEPNDWWCTQTGVCIRQATQPPNSSGPFDTLGSCLAAGCEGPPEGIAIWTCWFNTVDLRCVCKQGIDPPDPTPDWELQEQSFSQSDCIACQQKLVREGKCTAEEPPAPPPVPPLVGWWCTPNGDCIFTQSPPEGSQGPFISAEQCQAVCGLPTPPPDDQVSWWCLLNGSCVQTDNPPPTAIGPFGSLEECVNQCVAVPPDPDLRWWCDQETRVCTASVNQPGPQFAGPFETLADCETFCRGCPPSPTPPPTPPPVPPVEPCPPPVVICQPGKEPPCPPRALVDFEAECKPIEEPSEPEPTPGFLDVPTSDFSSLGWCEALASIPPELPPPPSMFAQLLGLVNPDGTAAEPPGWSKFRLFGRPIGQVAALILRSSLVSVWNQIDAVVRNVAPGGIGGGGFLLARSVIGFLNRLMPGIGENTLQRMEYHWNFHHPRLLPSAGEAIEGWLTNVWNKDDEQNNTFLRDCLVRANAALPAWFERLAEGRRFKFTPTELMAIARRLAWPPEVLRRRMREIGSILPADDSELETLTEQLPFLSDLTRFLVRDVADQSIVDDFGLDSEFNEKFQPPLSEIATKQGVSEETMRLIWRAHWTVPPPGQLASFFHLNRAFEGRTDEQLLEHFGLKPEDFPEAAAGFPLRASFDDVGRALVQQDILPFWVPKVLLDSFRFLPLRQLQAAIDRDLAPVERARINFRALGFADRDIDILIAVGESRAKDRARRNRWMQFYERGEASREKAKRQAIAEGVPERFSEEILDQASEVFENRELRRCIPALRKRFMVFDVDEAGVTTELKAIGADDFQIAVYLRSFTCERAARGRDLGAAQLCQFFDDGLITGQQYGDRLRKLGYDAREAQLILAACGVKIRKRRGREEAAAARRAETIAKAEARRRRTERNRELRRTKTMVDTALRLAKRLLVDVDTATGMVEAQTDRLRALDEFSIDEIILALEKASKATDWASADQWPVAVDQQAQAIRDFQEPALVGTEAPEFPPGGNGETTTAP